MKLGTPAPRLLATPLGADHSAHLVAGLAARLDGAAPEDWARVEIFVNSARMARRLAEAMAGRARLLPRIRLIADLGRGRGPSPLAQRLLLARAVRALIEGDPDLAPRARLFDLTDSLADLIDEMEEEGVAPEAVAGLDTGAHAAHFQRLQRFLQIAAPFFGDPQRPSAAGRLRRAVLGLEAAWQAAPPAHPVLVAGSTGSRGATFRLMQAVARLPQGAVVVPGWDPAMPAAVWARLDAGCEDHPQYRIARLARALDRDPAALPLWHPAETPPRVPLLSLAFRPAPVTDAWRAEGPHLPQIGAATEGLTLLEAPSQAMEARAIALRLREAAEAGTRAALISPDRTLTRQVTAALDAWGIEPDDSAGRPLSLSAPGRLLRHLAHAMGRTLTAEALAVLLKHPLCHTGADRGGHLLRTAALEVEALRRDMPFPDAASLRAWAAARTDAGDAAEVGSDEPVDPRLVEDAWPSAVAPETPRAAHDRDPLQTPDAPSPATASGADAAVPRPFAPPNVAAWAEWIGATLAPLVTQGTAPLADLVAVHRAAAEAWADGPHGRGRLWEAKAGEAAQAVMDGLARDAVGAQEVTPRDYADLIDRLLADQDVRDPVRPHPDIMIWGPIEARVQGADLVILGGLTEATWPGAPTPDPWLSRPMRAAAGLRRPDRTIGLAAHDVQQAAAGPQVWLTRSLRDAEAPTVPSRWLNRLTNLLGGASAESTAALDAIRARGKGWLALAARLAEAPNVAAATRPAPRPPVDQRPRRLSVTRIETLIRDPYAIYADRVLGLRPLDPLRQTADAPIRGTVLHAIVERFGQAHPGDLPPDAAQRLMAIADTVLADRVPWPAARTMWRARLAVVAPWFAATEAERRRHGTPAALEVRGRIERAGLTLTAEADRIDVSPTGGRIYDYKSGRPPSAAQEKTFNKQLLLEALILEAGGFDGLPAMPAEHLAYIGLGGGGDIREIAVDGEGLARVAADFDEIVGRLYDPSWGFTARRWAHMTDWPGDYDHLARHGEWSDTDAAVPEAMP